MLSSCLQEAVLRAVAAAYTTSGGSARYCRSAGAMRGSVCPMARPLDQTTQPTPEWLSFDKLVLGFSLMFSIGIGLSFAIAATGLSSTAFSLGRGALIAVAGWAVGALICLVRPPVAHDSIDNRRAMAAAMTLTPLFGLAVAALGERILVWVIAPAVGALFSWLSTWLLMRMIRFPH